MHNNFVLTNQLIKYIRGAKVGGIGGVATPPEFWKGGLNPPWFLEKFA